MIHSGHETGGLVLDEATHRYTYDGRRVAGCTEVLAGVGAVDTAWFRAWHADRGNKVHKAMRLLIDGRLDFSTVDPQIAGYVAAGMAFCREHGVIIGDEWNLTEHLVYSRAYQVAGRLDLFAWLFGAKPAVIDWKTGAEGRADLQTAFYADCMQEEQSLKVAPLRFAIKLQNDGNYRIVEYKRSRDLRVFEAAALVYTEFHLGKDKGE